MILDTRRLFCRLLRTLEIGTVCDVGSMDGTDALLFRRFLPSANILALEPNPTNFALMQSDERLARSAIRTLPFAASDRGGEAPFFIVRADYSTTHDWRGMSSLYRRRNDAWLADVVAVQTVRLDELLQSEALDTEPIALWIDTEGMAFEVVHGASAVSGATRLIHVEVETEAVVGANQKLFASVWEKLNDMGFTLVATDRPRQALQFNALFVRSDLIRASKREIHFWLIFLSLRRFVTRSASFILRRRLRRVLEPPRAANRSDRQAH